jgi:hypothetical protein
VVESNERLDEAKRLLEKMGRHKTKLGSTDYHVVLALEILLKDTSSASKRRIYKVE